jgi:ELWxxDGT repeat protein
MHRGEIPRRRARSVRAEALEPRALLSAQLVSDLWPGRNTSPIVREAVAFNGQTYFAVEYTGLENVAAPGIWRTDGTALGTQRVVPGIYRNVGVANGSLWFSGRPGARPSDEGRTNVYRLDASNAVTRLTDASEPGEDFEADPWVASLGDMTLLSITVWDPSHIPEHHLFVSQGTPQSTRDIGLATAESPFVRSGQYQYFVDTPTPAELYRTDGTAAGTVPVAPGVSPEPPSRDAAMADLNGSLLFMGRDSAGRFGLWKTDGTGTEFLHAFEPTLSYTGSAMETFDGRLYFRAAAGDVGPELWASDGTPAGTVVVKNISQAYGSDPDELTVFNGGLYFRATGPNQPRELWKTDGTEAGTVRVTSIGQAGTSGGVQDILGVAGPTLFLSAYDGVRGVELWRTDGTAGGTALAADIEPGVGSSYPGESGMQPNSWAWWDRPLAVAHADRLDFVAYDEAAGRELWTAPSAAPATPAVVARHVFFEGSAFDAGGAAPGAGDDAAVALDKAALLPGQAASFGNVTSYTRGINGLMVDVNDLPGEVTAADFEFTVVSVEGVASRVVAPAPKSVTVRRGAGAGGSDRVTLVWADDLAVRNAWLSVTLKANAHTGLAQDDVFSFGNLIGETGDGASAGTLRVNALDLGAVKRALNTASTLDGRYDFNRDGRVNALDLGAVKANLNRSLSLTTETVAAPAAVSPAAGAPLVVDRVWDESSSGLLD